MTEQDMPAKRHRRRPASIQTPPPRWPRGPAHGERYRRGCRGDRVCAGQHLPLGRTDAAFPLARPAWAHHVGGNRGAGRHRGRRPPRPGAARAPRFSARAGWLGDEEGEHPASARSAARAKAHGAAIDRAVREAAGLEPELPEDWSEVLRFVALMTDAAERRDMGEGGARTPFPPLRRTIRPMAPEAAAERWLARFRDLAGSSPADVADVITGSGTAGAPGSASEVEA